MKFDRHHIAAFLGDVFFRDHARPIEWLSLLALFGWLQFLVTSPGEFQEPRYAAFAAMSPAGWAFVIGVILLAQILVMRPSRFSHHIRFGAMMLATSIWSVIAWNFWATDLAPLAARTNTVITLVVGSTAVYLGVAGRR